MEEMMEMMKDLLIEIREIKGSQRDLYEYIKEIKTDNERMKIEIQELNTKIEELERDKKRKNLVITGSITNTRDERELKTEITNFFKKELKINAEIKDARNVGEERYIVEMETMNGKIEILKNKWKLKQLKSKIVYINEDLTRKETEIQKRIKEMATKERNKGNTVKIGYRKIIINDKRWIWDNEEEKLKESEFTQKPKNNKPKNQPKN